MIVEKFPLIRKWIKILSYIPVSVPREEYKIYLIKNLRKMTKMHISLIESIRPSLYEFVYGIIRKPSEFQGKEYIIDMKLPCTYSIDEYIYCLGHEIGHLLIFFHGKNFGINEILDRSTQCLVNENTGERFSESLYKTFAAECCSHWEIYGRGYNHRRRINNKDVFPDVSNQYKVVEFLCDEIGLLFLVRYKHWEAKISKNLCSQMELF